MEGAPPQDARWYLSATAAAAAAILSTRRPGAMLTATKIVFSQGF